MRFKRQRQSGLTLNLTSLIDVLCVMVIFFMLTTKFMDYRVIKLDVGDPDTADTGQNVQVTPTSPEHAIAIEVLAGGKIKVDGLHMEADTLKNYLKPRLLQHPEQEITIAPSDGSLVQDIITALDQVRLAGGRRFTITGDIS